MNAEIEAVAIIGMALRVPGAGTVDEFWRNLLAGTASVRPVSDEELLRAGVPQEMAGRPDYVRATADIAHIDRFDAEFFGFSPAEAAMLDPQHRLFLECAWHALEDAGHDPFRSPGTAVGLYGGTFMNKYLPLNLYTNASFLRSPSAFFARNYNDKDFLAGRAAYAMNLRGPAVTLQTACSTSLVATHVATQALLCYECDMALVGGVAINLPAGTGYIAMEGTMFSPSGRCRPFDARSDGTLFGSGACFVVLRRLADAVAAGDHVYAVIRGSAINNDGIEKVSFTAPNAQAQAAVITAAQTVAGVSPDTIGYVEAHGTGTRLGDPIEVSALTQAFRAGTQRTGFCALGSVKANIGHLDAAAGVAGLIRAALALERQTIPPQAGFESPNPQLELPRTPFYVPREPTPWPRGAAPRRAAVSSFGVGGTNAHVVLEEAPPPAPSQHAQALPHLLVLSGRSEAAVDEAAQALARVLDGPEPPQLDAVACTLAEGRREFNCRRYVVAQSAGGAAARLRARAAAVQASPSRPDVLFMFPGVGTQYPDMALQLYEQLPTFRRCVDQCADIVTGKLHVALHRFLFPSRFAGGPIDAESVPDVLAAVFCVDYALACQWMEWGVTPAGLLGHSLGEYVAACMAGVLTLEDALDLSVRRGRIFDAIPDGRMMGVPLPAEEVEPLLGEGLWLGGVNAPALCMVSGRQAALERLAASLAERGVACRPLPIRMASHSGLLEPFLQDFEQTVRGYRLSPPRIPFMSCVTGTWIDGAQATDPAYWVRQLRAPVRFMAMAREACRSPSRVLLEVGPGTTLTTLVGAQRLSPAPHAVSSMQRAGSGVGDLEALLSAAGRLWQAGAALSWPALRQGRPALRTPLPGYAFQRQRHWIAPGYPTGPGYSASKAETRLPSEALAQEAAHEDATTLPVSAADGAKEGLTHTEQTVARVWEANLGIAGIGLDDDFTVLGGHSLLAAQVMLELRGHFSCALSVVDLFGAPTVRGLASVIAARLDAPAATEQGAPASLAADVRLDPSIVPPPAGTPEGPAGTVLLTGATGFLGGHLLHELLRQTHGVVACLVRCESPEDGERRLRASLEQQGLPSPTPGRVRIVPGDLAAPKLGLADDLYQTLAASVDAVYHCGAWVNFSRPYAVLRAANVLGTEEVLRLAVTGRLKPVHHVSTAFVSMGAITAGAACVEEDAPLAPPEGHDTGYTQSKWVAEALCRLAMQRGIPVAVYRPGNILADTRSGDCNHDDYLSRMLLGCAELGLAPRRSYPLPVGAVDDVARALVAISRDPASVGHTYHLIDPAPLPWNTLLGSLAAAGKSIRFLDWAQWCAALKAELQRGGSRVLAPLADLLNAPADRKMPRFDVSNARSARERAGLPYPVLDDAYFVRMLAHLHGGVAAATLPGAQAPRAVQAA